MAQDEQVLVIERKVFDAAGAFQGLSLEVERYLGRFFQPGVPRFMPRAKAETDPTHKQLIPYVLMSSQGKFLSYVRGRRAGETRLVGSRSIGIGGHINPADDAPLFSSDFRDAYLTAVEREVCEEITINSRHNDRVVALLNDDSSEVGCVHLGIVHHWALEKPDVNKREQMMTQLAFMTPTELAAERTTMETWSQFCLDLLPRLCAG
jgi:predicted NUDIX family phosphoesterase